MSSVDPLAMLRKIRSGKKDHIEEMESFEMHEVLRACAADIQSESAKKVISWIVNRELFRLFLNSMRLC
jgi:hypothetical protein